MGTSGFLPEGGPPEGDERFGVCERVSSWSSSSVDSLSEPPLALLEGDEDPDKEGVSGDDFS